MPKLPQSPREDNQEAHCFHTYIYIYIFICVCLYVYMYVYIHIYRERLIFTYKHIFERGEKWFSKRDHIVFSRAPRAKNTQEKSLCRQTLIVDLC